MLSKTALLFIVLFCGAAMSAKINILTEHLAPFQIVEGNTISGLSTEIVEATLKEAKLTYSIEAYPWSLSYNSALQKKNTCIYSLARIPQRQDLFQWIGHITTSTISLYALKNKTFKIDNLAQAKDYKIAVIKDDVTHHFLLSKGFVENKNLYVMNNYDSLLKLLEIPSRQIDFVVINDDLINNRVKNTAKASKYQAVFLLKELTLVFYFACSLTTDNSLVISMTQAMAKLEKQGAYAVIKQRWQRDMVNII